MIYTPHQYQDHATQHIVDNDACGLFLDMGLGKTVSTLTAIDRLMNDDLEVEKVLVIAPKRVAEDTWINEAEKWDHLNHLRISIVLGSERERKEALRAKADIYVINRENVAWLVSFYGSGFPFDMIVIDELSSFKSAKSIRFKALRMIRPKVKRVVGLTGTPAPNGLLDLWSQLYLLDQGERLGKTLEGYRTRYFRKENDYSIHSKYEVIKDDQHEYDYYEQKIYTKISDICISMKVEDYLQLPGRIDRVIKVTLPLKIMQQYEDFERKQILALENLEEISAVNAGALTNKLLQFASGAVYDDEKLVHEVHNLKLEALEESVEAANGQPIIIFYWYKHELERIQRYLKHFKPVVLKDKKTIKAWNEKEIPVMLVHPMSAGHGLNLQYGGHNMVWYHLPWSLEYYQQGRSRVDRQGQTHLVYNGRLIVKGTMDEDVLTSLDNKASGQDALMNAVKARIEKYTGKRLKTT